MVAKLRFPRLMRTRRRKQKAVVGIFAFEVASVMSKLVHLWAFLSSKQVDRLRKKISDSVGIKKLVSHDDDFTRGLIPGELFENMVPLTKYVARLGKNYCSDPSLKDFEHAVSDWINNGVDPFGWELPWEKMEKKANKMERFILINANLYDGMKLLSDLEQTLNDITATLDGPILLEFQNKVELKRLEVENLKEESLWNRTYDYVGILLARSVFTIFSWIKSVFGVPQLMSDAETKDSDHINPSPSIFSKYKLLDAPPDTLGAAALALHYANIVIKIESYVRFPLFLYCGRHNLYSMLPANMRAELSERLPSIKSSTSSVRDLAAERKVAMAEILEWLAPLAHNTKKWHSKRNFQQKASVSRSHVLLVQTLYFANQQKTEATIMELVVGLQYIYQADLEAFRENDRRRRERKAASLEDQD
ncbi:protein PSK SIMULATOR 1-like [Rosa rugosa]|uniref:protein PSK SIMULATOR 1-like n=1 Tax=Rosa rugosa TaxID=74645 RepID=UPI002B408BF9|nr:protein PSK SIMULATOR 1-like [Rosa rugosa]